MSLVQANNIQPASGQALTIKDEGGNASITIQTDGDLTLAENAYLGSGKGIYFDGQTGTANQLSDYETGTWTPTLIGDNGGEIASYDSNGQKGAYTKIGRQVTVHLYIKVTSNSGPSGTFAVGNLPFTVADTVASTSFEASGLVGFFENMSALTSGVTLNAVHSGTKALMYHVAGTQASGMAGLTAVASNFSMRASLTYNTT